MTLKERIEQIQNNFSAELRHIDPITEPELYRKLRTETVEALLAAYREAVPERKDTGSLPSHTLARNEGWNAAIDQFEANLKGGENG